MMVRVLAGNCPLSATASDLAACKSPNLRALLRCHWMAKAVHKLLASDAVTHQSQKLHASTDAQAQPLPRRPL